MKNQITKKALQLLRDQFTRDGKKVSCSGVHTCTGTMPLWGQLVGAGYVKPMGGISLGHDFEYEITEDGRRAVEANAGEKDKP